MSSRRVRNTERQTGRTSSGTALEAFSDNAPNEECYPAGDFYGDNLEHFSTATQAEVIAWTARQPKTSHQPKGLS